MKHCLTIMLALALLAAPAVGLTEDLRALDRSGIAQYQQGDYEGALQTFRQALRIAPSDGLTLVLEGTALLATDDEHGADEAWGDAAQDAVWGSVAKALSGLLRWQRGDTLDAKTWFNMCQRHTTAYPYCMKLAQSLDNGDPVPPKTEWMQLSGFKAVYREKGGKGASPSNAPVINEMSRKTTTAVAAAGGHKGAGMPPSGKYRCMTSSGNFLYQMGQLVIAGNTYRYAPTGGSLSAPASFSMSASDNHLHWHGAMGALTQAPAKITDSWVERGSNYLSIIVKYKPQPNGYTFTMGCRNDLH